MTFGASGALAEIGPLNDGEIVIGSTGNASVAANITSGDASVTITNGAGTIDLSIGTSPVVGTSAALVYQDADIANATGDATIIGRFNTEIYDIAGDFTANTFTAPGTGRYFLAHSIHVTSLGAAHNRLVLWMFTSNANYYWSYLNSAVARDATSNGYKASGAVVADMDAGDIAQAVINVDNGAKTVTYSATGYSYFNIVRFD
jgi:hypothetical protein